MQTDPRDAQIAARLENHVRFFHDGCGGILLGEIPGPYECAECGGFVNLRCEILKPSAVQPQGAYCKTCRLPAHSIGEECQIAALRAFANEVVDCHTETLEGCDIEEMAIKHGLLVAVRVAAPCNNVSCACAEVGNLPGVCYRKAGALAAAPAESSTLCASCGKMVDKCEGC